MKKVENLLLLPVLLIGLMLLLAGTATIDISGGFHFYIIANSVVMPFVIGFFFLEFVLYKLIRKRHNAINDRWAWIHIGGSFLLVAIFEYCVLYRGVPAWNLSLVTADTYYTYMIITQQLLIIDALLFLLLQVVFLSYFAIQMFKKNRFAL